MADMRVLILLPGHQLFGQERALLTLGSILNECGINVHFLLHSRWPDEIRKKIEELGLGSSTLPFGTLWSRSLARREPGLFLANLWSVLSTSIKLLRILRAGSYTHIILGNATFSYYLLPSLWLTSVDVIYRHGDEPPVHSFFHRIANRLLFGRANHHVANCRFLIDRLAKLAPRIQPKLIYNIPGIQFDCVAKSYQPNSNKEAKEVRLLFVGQLSVEKGTALLIQAFRKLSAKYSNLVLDLVGEIPGTGEARTDNVSALLSKAQSDFPGQIFLHGYQSYLFPFYETADIHVCPSIWQDPSPNVILEAKQFGIPSVGFSVGGIPELIHHGQDGFVCRNLTPSSLADGIEYLLCDATRRQKAGQAAKRSIEIEFGPERYKHLWLKILKSDCASPVLNF